MRIMTQNILRNWGYVLNGYFLKVLLRRVLKTQPEVCGGAFFKNS